MSIQQQVQAVRARMAAAAESSGRRPEDIALCAATKVQSDDTIRAAIAAGITLCGENRVQELTAHLAPMPGPRSISSATSRPTRSSRWWDGWT